MSTTTLPQAPGAGTAKTTGILSIVLGLLCFPIGLVLAIIAIVQHNKAKGAVLANPGVYQPVGGVGLVTAIIGLVMPLVLAFIGIVAAIAIPALLGQRARARDKVAVATMTSTLSDLMADYDLQVESRAAMERIPSHMEAKLRSLGEGIRNPWNPNAPAFTYTIEVMEAADRDSIIGWVQARAMEKGVSVFMISLPDASRGRNGYLAGAVRIHTSTKGSPVITKVVELN